MNFLCAQCFGYDVLNKTNAVNKILQNLITCISECASSLDDLKSYFTHKRTNTQFERYLLDTVERTENVDADPVEKGRVRSGNIRRKFQYEGKDEPKTNVLDTTVSYLDERFEQLKQHSIY